ncbi:MAG: hypothetical protein AB7K68_00640 [Bacteriovoracia bacterium]
METRMKNLKTACLTLLALSLASTAHAVKEGGDISGGGSEVGGMSYENFLLKNKFDPKAQSLGGEQELTKIKSLLPSLGERMEGIYKKRWILVGGDDIAQLSNVATGIPLNKKEVMLQNERFVYVNRDWLKNATAEEKSVMLTHEYWQYIRVSNNNALANSKDKSALGVEGGMVAPGAVPEINFEMLDNTEITAKELQALAKKFNFGTYGTKEETEKATAEIEKTKKKVLAACAKATANDLMDLLEDAKAPLKQLIERTSASSGLGAELRRQQKKSLPKELEDFGDHEVRDDNARWGTPGGSSLGAMSMRLEKYLDNSEAACKALGVRKAEKPKIAKPKTKKAAAPSGSSDEEFGSGSAQ